MTQEEIWKPVSGYENLYEISDCGRVKSLAKDVNCNGYIRHQEETIMSPQKDIFGYLNVQLHKDGAVKTRKIHRLVAETFIPNQKHYRCINHKDEVKTNNHVSNLEWCTHKYNASYGTCKQRMADKIKKPVMQYDRLGNFIARYDSIGEASKATRTRHNAIGQCCMGLKRHKTANGFVWRYEKDGAPESLPKDNRIVMLSESGTIISIYNNISDASRENNILKTSIHNCLSGRTKSAGGYLWKRKTDLI